MLDERQEPQTAPPPPGAAGFLRKRWLVLAGLAAAFVIVILVVRHQQSKSAGTGPGGPGGMNAPVTVAVAKAAPGDIQIRIPALGTITPLATVTVRTQISGQLQKIAFTEGQTVRAGDFLAQVDPRPYEAALAQARGNLRRDQALRANAELDLRRFEGLIKEDSVSQQQLDTQRALVDQYKGVVEADQAAVRTAELNLQYAHIVSPVTGRVGLRQVDQGNYVTPGDANGIVVITQMQPITALFTVPEDNLPALMRRLRGGQTLKVEAYDRSGSGKLADGSLMSADNQIDTSTGTIKLRALFDNKDGMLFPNQFVNIQLLEELLRDQIVIPNSAVHRGAPNGVLATFVYLVNADSTVAVRAVSLGEADGDRVAVRDGLAVGDVVVTEGGDRLRDGAKVILPGQATPATGPGGTAGAGGAGGGKPGDAKGSRRKPKATATP